MSQYLTNQRTSWKFIVAKAPWWGGFWERMVRSVKRYDEGTKRAFWKLAVVNELIQGSDDKVRAAVIRVGR